jgi:ATP-dependent protease HslVU (ClpYQ) peptidase subunit
VTAIVGLEHAGKVYIGADSAGTAGWLQIVRADEKVFTNGPFVIGFTTSFRMGQLLRYKLSVAEQAPSQTDDFRFMSTVFIDTVRTCLKDGGFAKIDNGVEQGGTFLVGYRGALYCVGSDFQVGRSVEGFDAVGYGDELALGALAASALKDPTRRVKQALGVAARFSAGVAGPFKVVAA